jgi:hypothetical protein
VLSKNHLDNVSVVFKQKIKKWGIKAKSGEELTQKNLEEISNFIEDRLIMALKKFTLRSQHKRRHFQYRRIQIQNGQNNISRMKNFSRPTMIGSMTNLKSQNELMKSGGLQNAKFSEGNQRGRTQTQLKTNINFETSQISASIDHMPLTRMNSKNSYNRRIFNKLWNQDLEHINSKTTP